MNEAKLWFWIFIDMFIVVLAVSVWLVVLPAVVHYSNSLAPARTVVVTAEGKTTATPDLAELSFSVVTQGKDPQVLATNNNTKMNSVMQFLSEQNIASSDIQTVSYDLQPNYQYDANG
ncbi:MAG: SIMPL domain-containing protein, partial [Candidatus Pacebacteria bacterium]|nr:SIMPL domain-containing protein [Candidatus Paceibacterota bacterium]